MNALARLGAPTLERDNVVMVEVLAAFDRDGWRQCATVLNERFSQDRIHVRTYEVQILEN